MHNQNPTCGFYLDRQTTQPHPSPPQNGDTSLHHKENLKLSFTPSAWLSTTSILSLNLHPQTLHCCKPLLQRLHLNETAWLLITWTITQCQRTMTGGQRRSWSQPIWGARLFQRFCKLQLLDLHHRNHAFDGLNVYKRSLGLWSCKIQELKILEDLKFKNVKALNLQVQESESSGSSQGQSHGSSKAQRSKAPEFKLLEIRKDLKL